MIHLGVIGTGSIAHRFLAGVPFVPAAQVTVVFNRTRSRAEAFAAQYGLAVADSLEELLASPIDAVYIATPHPSHASLAMAALRAGKAVLCEKPAAITTAELDEVLAVARQAGRLYMEAMKPPFFPLYQAIRQRVDAGEIGAVRFVRAGFSSLITPAEAPTLFDPQQGGGALLDVGIYAAFFAVDWLGAASQVSVQGRIADTGVDTFAAFQGVHEEGQSQLFCGIDTLGPGDAILAGAHGYVHLHEKWWSPTAATLVNRSRHREELVGASVGSGLNYELAHFCDLVSEGGLESPILTHAKTRAALAMVETARTALMADQENRT